METAMSWPNQPEYLQLFSNDGPVTVRVRFSSKEDGHRSITKMNMRWDELNRIIDPETSTPYRFMYFDAYRCPISRYEIDPGKNVLTIVVGNTGLP
jgi:hypothetical protein